MSDRSSVTFDSDRAMTVCGVPGRLTHRTRKPGQAPELWFNQKWVSERRPVKGWGKGAYIQADIRLDDSCGNGHNTFAVTGHIAIPGRSDWEAGGSIHEEIARYFPELAHLIRWHCVSTDSPMHYVANTLYHAGDRDHRGKRAGEPYAFKDVIQFGAVPIQHKVPKGLLPFLREIADYDRDRKAYHLIPVAVAYKNKPGDTYDFKPKYQFAGQDPLAWHACPFDSEREAAQFAEAFLDHSPTFHRVPTLFSEGKARDLAAARSTGVWPEATDAELCVEPAELRAALEARLPALVAAFRADIEAAGFLWSPADYRKPEAEA